MRAFIDDANGRDKIRRGIPTGHGGGEASGAC